MSCSLLALLRSPGPRAGEPIASAQLRHLGGLRTPEPSGRHSRADQTCALRTRLHSRSCPRSGRRMAAVRRRTELRGFHRRLAAVSVQVLSCRTCRIVSLARLASCPDVPRRSAGGSAASVSSVCLAGVSRQSPPWCDSAGPCQFAVRGVIFSCLDWLSRGGKIAARWPAAANRAGERDNESPLAHPGGGRCQVLDGAGRAVAGAGSCGADDREELATSAARGVAR